MNHFRRGFAMELLKLAAFPQHEIEDTYDSGSTINTVMDQTQGASAKTGLKTGFPIPSPSAGKKRAPTPLTTPNHMVDYSGGS